MLEDHSQSAKDSRSAAAIPVGAITTVIFFPDFVDSVSHPEF
jgi:hypothetical protein